MQALYTVEIRVIDHIIIADGEVASMAQSQILVSGELVDAQTFDVKIQSSLRALRNHVKIGESAVEEYGVFQKGELD